MGLVRDALDSRKFQTEYGIPYEEAAGSTARMPHSPGGARIPFI
jgi:hypothetical protein